MEPYYVDNDVKLYLGDSCALIHSIKDYDLIFTSPPYGTHQNYGSRIDDWRPDHKFWEILYKNSLPNSKLICHVDNNSLNWWMDEIQKAGWNYKHCFCYINPDRSYRTYSNFPCCWEPILAFSKTQTFDIKKNSSVIQSDIIEIQFPENRFFRTLDHPCHADYYTWLRIIQLVDFQVLFDPFAGIGTSLLCAKALKKKSVGIELNPHFCKLLIGNFMLPTPQLL